MVDSFRTKKRYLVLMAFVGILLTLLTGCVTGNEDIGSIGSDTNSLFDGMDIDTFSVTSENMCNGVWDTIITNTDNGNNLSPQLSWDSIDGVSCYAIYMIDSSAGNWIHWKSSNVTETDLPEGWASESEYIGPYPPGGTHDYEIYVLALKKPVSSMKGSFDEADPDIKADILSLDIDNEGAKGNIAAYGCISGTYTHGE